MPDKKSYLNAPGKVRPILANVLEGLGLEPVIRAWMEKPSSDKTLFGKESPVKGGTIGKAIADVIMPPEIGPLAMTTAPLPPYSKAPNNLMGFAKDGYKQKGFSDYNYKTTVPVKVKFSDGTYILEEINGLNAPHALERARRNWSGAEIEQASKDELNNFLSKQNDFYSAKRTPQETLDFYNMLRWDK